VRRTSMSWVSGLLAVLVAAGSAPTAFAESLKTHPPATSLKSSIAATVNALQPETRALAQTADASSPEATPNAHGFFRTRTGVAAIVLMVAGAAFVAISIPNDNEKVHSPIR
jgi:hypothetical protein